MIFVIGNRECLIDESDLDLVLSHKWHISKVGYAIGYSKKYKTCIEMHRLVMNFAPKHLDYRIYFLIDHIDRNRLNNQKSNLRVATGEENALNTPKRKGTTSIYKGVSFILKTGKWFANIKGWRIGYFDTELEAYNAVAQYLKKRFPDFQFRPENHIEPGHPEDAFYANFGKPTK